MSARELDGFAQENRAELRTGQLGAPELERAIVLVVPRTWKWLTELGSGGRRGQPVRGAGLVRSPEQAADLVDPIRPIDVCLLNGRACLPLPEFPASSFRLLADCSTKNP